MTEALALLPIIFFLVLPLTALIFLVRKFMLKTNRSANLGLREIFLGCLMLCAGVTGLVATIMIPGSVFNVRDTIQSSTTAIVYILASMIFLMTGITIKGITGKFLMILGIIMLLISLVPILYSIGKIAGLIATFLAFIILVGLTIKASKKGTNNG